MKKPMIGHYTPKIIEEWSALRNTVRRSPKVPTGEIIDDSATWLLEVLEQGVCWSINQDAFPLVWNTDISSLDFENSRLPYPTMCIEYEFDYQFLGVTKEKIDKLADAAVRRVIMLTEVDEDCFALISAYQPEDTSMMENMKVSWMFSPLAMMFSYSSFDDMEKWMKVTPEELSIQFSTRKALEPWVVPAAPMFQEAFENMTEAQLQGLMTDMADEIRVAFGLLGILSCNNAPIREILPPAQLNKKRNKRGKSPLPTYRTLHISDHVNRPKTSDSHNGHASPRTHWRRGHIRNQPTAKGYIRKWIKPTIVGTGDAPKPEVVLT